MLEFFNNTNGLKMKNYSLGPKLGENIEIPDCVRYHQIKLEVYIFPKRHALLFTQDCRKMLVIGKGPGHVLYENSVANIHLHYGNMPAHQRDFIFQIFIISWQ